MLSKIKIKYIHSLSLKKRRREEGVFIAEGFKTVEELLPHFKCTLLIGTQAGLQHLQKKAGNDVIEVTQEELAQASLLCAPQEVLALFEQPSYEVDSTAPLQSLCLALDDIQDPGNLGTIVRLADWFGIKELFCSHDTADIYNPKAIQATMGAIARVKVHYVDLPRFLQSLSPESAIYGTFLNGENIYKAPLMNKGVLVMGNEGNGISREIEALVKQRLYIPPYPDARDTSESLNVAVATAVACSEFRRRIIK